MSVVNVSVLDDRTDKSRMTKRCDWISLSSSLEHRMVVNEDTLLDKFFNDVKKRLGKDDKIGTLSILCHGYGRQEYLDEERTKEGQMRGGFGLEFCKEGVNLKNAVSFSALKRSFEPKKGTIMILGCAAAVEETFKVVPSGKETATSFGRRMCFAIARATGAVVVASNSFQDIQAGKVSYPDREGGRIVEKIVECLDPGRWEGKVWAFAPDGKVTEYIPEETASVRWKHLEP